MNCEAQFSEIFTRRVFGYLNLDQKKKLIVNLQTAIVKFLKTLKYFYIF